jgi:hypothetical protein
MSPSKRERNGKRQYEPSQCAKFKEEWGDFFPRHKPLFNLRSGNENAPHHGDKADDEERFKNEL